MNSYIFSRFQMLFWTLTFTFWIGKLDGLVYDIILDIVLYQH